MKSRFSLRQGPPFAALIFSVALASGCRPVGSGPSPARTSAAITPADVRSRIYVVADDSMLGRQSGTIGNYMMTMYLEREMRRLGLEPGGENGSFFQVVPMVRRAVDSTTTHLAIGPKQLTLYSDFAPLRPNTTERYAASLGRAEYQTVYGGRAGDSAGTLSVLDAAGKIIILDAPLGADGKPTGVWGTAGAISVSRYPTAAGIAIAGYELITPASATGLRSRANAVADRQGSEPRPAAFIITSAVAREIIGAPLGSTPRGARGKTISASAAFDDAPVPYAARNVIAILRGRDPALRSEYVALGAHSDHVGVAARAVEHDSLRSYYRVMRPEGAQRRGAQPGDPTAEQWARIRASIDSLRRLRPPRMDSISNGADDDGSGSVALLEIAEALANAPRPRRSVILVWHTAEEGGLLGSSFFMENPTVPRNSIVAQINMDMVGRGGPADIAGGGPRYLQVIGSRRISTDLGDVIDSVNSNRPEPFRIDYSWDAPGHIMARYCRSDHWNYARRGIPVAFLSRGYHPDYHVVTDEPQYINYDGLSRVSRFVREVTVALAERNDRPVADRPLPNPLLPCRH